MPLMLKRIVTTSHRRPPSAFRIAVGNPFMWAATAFALMVASSGAEAQTGPVAGRATDASTAAGPPGVQITVVGTLRTATARDNGAYTLTLTPCTYVLTLTQIGYATST